MWKVPKKQFNDERSPAMYRYSLLPVVGLLRCNLLTGLYAAARAGAVFHSSTFKMVVLFPERPESAAPRAPDLETGERLPESDYFPTSGDARQR